MKRKTALNMAKAGVLLLAGVFCINPFPSETQARERTLCVPMEKAFASGERDGKMFSVCADFAGERMTSISCRFGEFGKRPEAEVISPVPGAHQRVTWGNKAFSGGRGQWLRFRGPKGVSYVLYSWAGNGGERSGFAILKGTERLADYVCPLHVAESFQGFGTKQGLEKDAEDFDIDAKP